MTNFFLRIFDFFQRRHRLFVGSMTAMTVLLLVMMASLTYNENIYDFLPVGGNDQKAINLYQDISGGQSIFTMFTAREDNPEAQDRLTEAVDTFAARLKSGHGWRHVKQATTQVDFEKILGIKDFVYRNMPLMLCDSDYVRMERLLTTPRFADDQLTADVQMVMMPVTGFFTSSISSDPLGLFAPVMERLQARQSAMPFEIDDGYLFTPGKKYAFSQILSPYGAMESSNNAELVAYVDSVSRQTMAAVPGIEVASTGSPVIAVGNANQIREDSVWAISIAVTLIVLLLVYSFRKFKHLLLIGASILFGWLFAMGFIAVFRSDVSLIVLGIGSVIIGIAVNYPLHFILHTDHGGTVREVLKDMVSPLLIGNITTVGAFVALMPLDAPALRDLGLFAAFMLVGTIFFVLIFLPHLVHSRKETGEERLSFARLSQMSPDRHRWVLWVVLLLTMVFGWFSLDTSFDANMHKINYMTKTQTRLLSEFSSSAGMNDTAHVYVVTEADTWDEALQQRASLAPLLDSLKRENALNSFSDATSFICSREEQLRRINRWNQFWAEHRDDVERLLSVKGPHYGFSEDAFADFFAILNANYQAHSFEYFEPLRSGLLNRSFSKSMGRCSVVEVIDADGKDMAALETCFNHRLGKHGYAFDFSGMNSSMANSLSDNFNYIGFACGFIVFVFLWLSFGRLELSVLAFLPMVFGWIWILGVMDIFNMKFNIVNVILATFIFGQGDDYTIFITDGLINEYAYRKKLLPSYKNSIIISALIMFIGMGSLIVADHPALYSLAEVTIVGMLTVVLMAWIVPPLVFKWMVSSRGKARRNPLTVEQLLRTCCLPLARLLKRPGLLFGVHFEVHKAGEENFGTPYIAMCPLQSSVDSLYLRSVLSNAQGYAQTYEEASRKALLNGVDILPVYLHGTTDVMPSGTHFVGRGKVDLKIGVRIQSNIPQGQQLYDEQMLLLQHETEDSHYYHDYIIYKYVYKGYGIEKETRRLLRQYDDFSQWIDGCQPPVGSVVSVLNAGNGQFSLLFALVHPEVEVHSYSYDADGMALAMACEPVPANLHVHYCESETSALCNAEGSLVINLSEILV